MKTKSNILFILILLFITPLTFSQSTLGGMHGHLIVPDANTYSKNTLAFGTLLYPEKYAYIRPRTNGRLNDGKINNELYNYLSVNLIEWVDISVCVSRILNADPILNGIGDRSINFKFRVLKETPKRPALAVTLEFPGGKNNWLASNAILASKTHKHIQLSAGYGLPLVLQAQSQLDPKPNNKIYGSIMTLDLSNKWNEYLNGLLLALSYELIIDDLAFYPTIEFDGYKWNTGVKTKYKAAHFSIFASNFNALSAGISMNGLIH